MAGRSAAVLALAAGASAQSFLPLFNAYEGYPNCYRQPILLNMQQSNSLVAIAEGRTNISWCSGTDWPTTIDFPIYSRRSLDMGRTWSQQVLITHGNLDFLTAVVDQQTGAINLMIQYGDNGTVSWTSPDGQSWSGGQQLNIVTPAEITTVIPGCGHGLQIQSQYCKVANCLGSAGRLVLPFVCTTAGDVSNDTACGNCHTCLLTSDDHGASWQLGAVSEQNGSREAALLQLDSSVLGGDGAAVVYAGERNLGNATGERWHAISADGGASFSVAGYGVDAGLPDVVTANWTGVVSGYARVDTSNGPVLVFTAPVGPNQRQGLSAWASTDFGSTWSAKPLTLWPGPAAYSDTIALNSTHVAVLFENGDVGSGDFAMRISFGIFAVADILAA